MEDFQFKQRRFVPRRGTRGKFNPDRLQVMKATEDYLLRNGKITRLKTKKRRDYNPVGTKCSTQLSKWGVYVSD